MDYLRRDCYKGVTLGSRLPPVLNCGDEDVVGDRARRLTRSGAIAAGAVLALGGAARSATGAAPTRRDVQVLQFALVLERFEDAFYRAALDADILTGELLRYARTVARHEQAHTAFIEKALGQAAGQPPQLDVTAAVRNEDTFTDAAIKLEDTAVAAYNGQAANVSAAVLAPAARIVSVEARHAAWIRDIAGQPPAADPVDPAWTEKQVTAALRELGLSG
jgi:rubrerythrin